MANDPQIASQLDLTAAQTDQLRRASLDFDADVGKLQILAQTNLHLATAQFSDLMRERLRRIQGILSNEESAIYQQLIGEPFNFPANFQLSSTATR